MEINRQKQCSKCHKLKPPIEFYKHPTSKDGHSYKCKDCYKEYYQINKEKVLLYSKKLYIIIKGTEKYKKRKREYMKKWRKQNPIEARMHLKKSNKKYIKSNSEKTKDYDKKYRQTLRGKINEIKKAYKKRLLLKNCDINDLTSKQIQTLLEKTKRCRICNKLFNKKRKKTLDHIIPLFKNGNNTLMNIQIVCVSCNSKKGIKNYTEFNGGQILMFV